MDGLQALLAVTVVAALAPLIVAALPGPRVPPSGMTLDVQSIIAAPLRLFVFFILLLVVRGLPSLLVYRRALPLRQRVEMTFITATTMPLMIALAVIGLSDGVMLPANAAALVGAGVLDRAEIGRAAQVVIAVNRDDTAVLVALTARQLNRTATIVAAVREEENRQLVRQNGADHVVVSSDAAGQMLAMTTVRPAAGMVINDLLERGRGLDLVERPVGDAELGAPVRDVAGAVIAVVRGNEVLASNDPRATPLARGDRLILVSSPNPP